MNLKILSKYNNLNLTFSKNLNTTNKNHLFHLVNPSIWPFVTAFFVLLTVLGGVKSMHNYSNGGITFFTGLFLVTMSAYFWWSDIIVESKLHHTSQVRDGLRLGMILFIISEVMFFFGFFWAAFSAILSPTVQIGSVWPPVGIETMSYTGIPLYNTILLLSSGAFITCAHHTLINSKKYSTKAISNSIINISFIVTLFLAICFTLFQAYEYSIADFHIHSGIYGSIFYLTTGFHGLHVLIGTIFLAVCYVRFLKREFTKKQHIGFESAVWYWHFVDVVWILLYIVIYWWGS